jgi:hypothetical protein
MRFITNIIIIKKIFKIFNFYLFKSLFDKKNITIIYIKKIENINNY